MVSSGILRSASGKNARGDVTKTCAGISLIRVRRLNDEIRKWNRSIFFSAHLGGGNNPLQILFSRRCIEMGPNARPDPSQRE